jgi:23S rRNA (guanine745-N1)-methyltransferase
MLNESVRFLRCPHCGAGLSLKDGSVVCANRHSFDVSRQGYVNLLSAAPKYLADTPAMVEARESFLRAGHYGALADQIARSANSAIGDGRFDGCAVDVGGGTGYYLGRLLDLLPAREGIVLDYSKYAARRAARAHPRMSAVIADAWQPLPIATGAAALVLNIFAPRSAPELRRIVHREGALIVVTPGEDHLSEIVGALGLLKVDERKEERLAERLDPYFDLARSESFRRAMRLDTTAIEQLVAMGPNAWHTDTEALRTRAERLPSPMIVTASVRVNTYRAKAK